MIADWLAGTPLEVIPGATIGGLVSGLLLPALGMWIVLQRVVFLGVTIAQVAAAGVALGLFLDLPVLPLGFALTLGATAFFTRPPRRRPLAGGDAWLGAAFCAASALALLFISRSPAEMDEVHHVLHGNLVYANERDVRLVALVGLTGVATIALFFKQILFSTFDRETAAALGLATRRWTLLLFGILAVVLTVSMRTTGSLLSFAMLVLPPLAALQLRRGLVASFLWASALGVLGTLAGLMVAVTADLHLESAITVTLFALLPVVRAYVVHPLLGVALAAALGALVPLLEPAPVTRPASDVRRPSAGSHASHELLTEPVHVELDVKTVERFVDVDGTPRRRVAWSLHLHAHQPDVELPPALWLLLSVDGRVREVPLVEDTDVLTAEAHRATGLVVVEGEGALAAQVWSGPSHALEALPLDDVEVTIEDD